jgi:hypothetical protein
MAVTNYPNGVGSFGMPVFPGAPRPYTGTAFFVCNASGSNGSDGNNGLSPSQPLATLAKAITLVTAGKDDVIFVLAGHAESLGAAAAVACSKAGFSIVGLGNGRTRPVFTWTTTDATWTVSGANVAIYNLVFIGEGIDAVVTMFSITADECQFNGCEFQIGKTSFVPLLGITITGAINRFKFFNNFVHGLAVANCTNFIQIAGGGDGHQFVGNYIKGNFTTTLGAINNITTLCTNILIKENTLINATASATKVAVFLTGTTGAIVDNRCGIGSGAAPFTADAAHWSGNWSAAAVATNGTLV